MHADQEVRLTQDPFPLYPGEELETKVTKLRAVPTNTALRLRAIADFDDRNGTKRYAHDEWLFTGPGEKSSFTAFTVFRCCMAGYNMDYVIPKCKSQKPKAHKVWILG